MYIAPIIRAALALNRATAAKINKGTRAVLFFGFLLIKGSERLERTAAMCAVYTPSQESDY